MKKTGIILAIALLTSVSVFAQREYSTFSARISTFGRSFDRPSIELEFTKAYGVPAYQVRDYYEGVDNNWGDLSLAFEFSRFFNRPVVVILDSYHRYHSWDRVAHHFGAKYNSKRYKRLAKMMYERENYWNHVYDNHRRRHYAENVRYDRSRDHNPRHDNDRYYRDRDNDRDRFSQNRDNDRDRYDRDRDNNRDNDRQRFSDRGNKGSKDKKDKSGKGNDWGKR